MKLLRQRRDKKVRSVVDVIHQRRLGMSEMVLAAVDTPGLLAEVTGVLHANRIDVVDAAIYSRDPAPDEEPEALDIFRVRDGYGRAVTDETKWKKIRTDLEAVLSGQVPVETLVALRPNAGSVVAWRTPAVPTEIKIDNDVSRECSVIEVITEDRPGVLYAISRTLFVEGLDIHRSKIATEANRAVDTFYVRTKATNEKVTAPARIQEIKQALLAALPRI
jgi:[protein-PII] uridylyltransferase